MNTNFSLSRALMASCAIVIAAMAAVAVHADNKPPFSLQGKPQSLPGPNPQNLQVVKPDLIVVSVTPGAPPSKPALVRVQNVGNGASVATNVKLSCQARHVPNFSSNCQPGTLSANVNPLAPGAQETVTVPTGPLGKSGTPLANSRITACLDSANVVKESNEANNCGSGNW